jgi:glycosyltransferase involved in cell wall biosynthesis
MLSHSYYEEDPRVRREAEALVGAGRPVDVFSLRRRGDSPDGELDGVRIHRLDVQRQQGARLGTYLAEYVSFLLRSGAALTRAHRVRRYAIVQVHTLPDFLVFGSLPLRLAGVPVILDLHEAMPEFFRVRFPRASSPLAHRLLLLQERAATGFATAVITVNDALADRLVRLGVPAEKLTVVANSPSLERFDPDAYPDREFMADGVLRLAYAGALTPMYELDVALRAMAVIRSARPGLQVALDVYGRGDSEAPLRDLAAALGLAASVSFHGRVPIDDVPAAIARADVGLAPTRRNPFTELSLSTKIFEYGAMARPVVASRLSLVDRAFPEDAVERYTPGDEDNLAAAILRLVDDRTARESRVSQTLERVRDLAWEREQHRYLALVDRLVCRT